MSENQTPKTDERPEEKKRRKGLFVRIVASVAVLGMAISVVSIASLALFTDSATSTGNTFTTGTVDIDAAPAVAALTMPAMAPGDEVTAPLTVTNLGTLDLRYATTSLTTEDVLAAELLMTVRTGVTTCDDTNWDADGTQVYQGVLGSTAPATAVLGSVAQGFQAGDRTLAPGAFEDLCFNVTLPMSAVAEGATTTATFTFQAEQVTNNP